MRPRRGERCGAGNSTQCVPAGMYHYHIASPRLTVRTSMKFVPVSSPYTPPLTFVPLRWLYHYDVRSGDQYAVRSAWTRNAYYSSTMCVPTKGGQNWSPYRGRPALAPSRVPKRSGLACIGLGHHISGTAREPVCSSDVIVILSSRHSMLLHVR